MKMNQASRYLQEFLILKLIYPVLLQYINNHLITLTDEMEKDERENNIPILEHEYEQLPFLKFIYSILFNYLHNNLITRANLLEQCQVENNLYQLKYEEVVHLQSPISNQKIPAAFTDRQGKFEFTNPFAAVVKNAELFGIHAIGFTEHKNIILETTSDRVDCLEHTAISTLRKGFNPQYIAPVDNVENINVACSLINYWSHLYFHWVTECLTQLEALEYYSKKTGEKPILIIDKDSPKWKIDSLKLMGYSQEDCRQWNGYRAKVNKLVVCSKRREGGRVSVRACHWLRERALSNINSNDTLNIPLSENIFISRRKAKSRYIINEEEVINFLSPMGFIPYVLEDIDWHEQVRLFSQAKIIVAPHGAGLCNMVFSQKATIIEIFSQKISHGLYTVAQGLGFQYGCMFCESTNENILVNCQDLHNLIQRMLK